MGRDIRIFRAGAVYHVTNYAYRGELRLSPGECVNVFVEGCLAKAAKKYGVRIMLFKVMGNHFHIVVQVPFANLGDFMEYFQKELSTRLNRYRGVGKSNFPERYVPQEIASPADYVELAARILTNAVRARLVREAADWPGVSSLAMHRAGQTSRTVLHASRRQAAQMRESGMTPALARKLERVELKLSPPPFWRDLDPVEVQQRISELVYAEEERLQAEIDEGNERTVGRNRILNEHHRDQPDDLHWRSRGRCVSRDSDFAAAYNVWFDKTTKVYKRAAAKWRNFREWGEYPPGTYPPGWLQCLPPSAEVGPPLPWQTENPRAA